MVEHLRSLAGPRPRRAGDLTVTLEPRSSAIASAPPSPASWPSCVPRLSQMSRSATSVAGASELVASSSADAGRAVEEIARASATSPPAASARCAR
jgi:hypothetical protein